MSKHPTAPSVSATGIEGLDDILAGGLTPHRLYLVEGVPGSGKTTLALQFLIEGVRRGERVLYITLSETEAELRSVAASHGWDLKGIDSPRARAVGGESPPGRAVHDVPPVRGRARRDDRDDSRGRRTRSKPHARRLRFAVGAAPAGGQSAALSPADPRAQAVLRRPQLHRAAARRHDQRGSRPAGAEHRARRSCGWSSSIPSTAPSGGGSSCSSTAASTSAAGYHDYVIRTRRPRGVPAARRARTRQLARRKSTDSPAGSTTLDTLLGGGIERGTSTLIVGAPGTGKSTLAAQFAAAGGRAGRARGDVHVRRERSTRC